MGDHNHTLFEGARVYDSELDRYGTARDPLINVGIADG
jgi:hypothetical protein